MTILIQQSYLFPVIGPCHSKSMLDDSVYSKNNPAKLSSTCCVASLPNGDKFEGIK